MTITNLFSVFLEDLANELFAEIFSYLNEIDVLNSFSCLNNRFQRLTIENCLFSDLQSIRKWTFPS
ncbi:hypothetical protein I4U23_022332 [Adineta vaga]|nr:hypothetical protein I4U23_022332 [Adineta vaga]